MTPSLIIGARNKNKKHTFHSEGWCVSFACVMKIYQAVICILAAATSLVLCSCSSSGGGVALPVSNVQPASKSMSELYSEVRVTVDMVPKGQHGRRDVRSMSPRYITIHSTRNFDRGATALKHAEAMGNGAFTSRKLIGGNRTGYLTWHYTVDQSLAVQHLPRTEQGEHADFDGPGNNSSIGIEMCENAGNDLTATLDRTAKLTAWLMHKHGVPLNNVVPHYHWPRKLITPARKACPQILLDHGVPGKKWKRFLALVDRYYKSIAT